MKLFWKQFLQRGLAVAGGGPMILAVIYWILGRSGVILTPTPDEVALGILTVTLLAFICGGSTAIYQAERLPLATAGLIHGGVLYLTYLLVYLLNGWLMSRLGSILVFTCIFAAGYGLIWLVIYFVSRKRVAQVNAIRRKPSADRS